MPSLISALLALSVTSLLTINALPIPDDSSTCVGSSFSPTNCNSPDSQSINIDPDVNVAPSIDVGDLLGGLGLGKRDDDDGGNTCVGSSFSPTNCDSPGSQNINVDPDVDVSPSVDVGDILGGLGLKERDDGSTCVGSSFSPMNCDSPGSQNINVDPDVDVSPSVDVGDILGGLGLKERDDGDDGGSTCVGSSFSPTNCDSPNSQNINVDPDLDVSPTIEV